MKEPSGNCVFCERGSRLVPLLSLEYAGGIVKICPQHLPVLIHDPAQFVGLIAGAETFQASEHHD